MNEFLELAAHTADADKTEAEQSNRRASIGNVASTTFADDHGHLGFADQIRTFIDAEGEVVGTVDQRISQEWKERDVLTVLGE